MASNCMPCPTCSGTRRITVMVPQVRTGTVYRNAQGFPAWPCDGGTPYRMSWETGRIVARCHECPDCGGLGTTRMAVETALAR